ncbi:MAG: hypothetical protein H6718_04815 [Polyangiaceae bacterium]|nr:hypothetical protein [Polyangiaceae bacterium]MCB9609130.1 hypothetical protein [Polyangiaceae bacterium]
MPGPESDRESTFSGRRGRVIRTAVLPLLGIALFGLLGPFAELLRRSSYSRVPSESYFTLPSVFDALVLGFGCVGLTLVARRAAGRPADAPVSHRRVLRGIPAGVFVLFAVAQMYGLLQVVDRTPRDFPWQLFLGLSLVSLSAGVALTRRGLRLTSWRCFTSQLAGHVVLMAPPLCWLLLDGLRHEPAEHYAGPCAALCLFALVGLLWAGRSGSRRVDTLAVALCVITLLAAAPIFLSARITRSHVAGKGEECEVALAAVPVWRAGPGHDPVCEPGALGPVSWAESAVVGVAGLGGLMWWLKRRRKSWNAAS